MEEKDEEITWLICMQIQPNYAPVVRSYEDKCSQCGCRLWVAKSSPKDVKLICQDCIKKLLKAEKIPVLIQAPTSEQLRDMMYKQKPGKN